MQRNSGEKGKPDGATTKKLKMAPNSIAVSASFKSGLPINFVVSTL